MIERRVPGFKISAGVNRNSYRPCWIPRISEHMMTSDNPIDYETLADERLDNTLTVDDRQPTAPHSGGHRHMTNFGLRIGRRHHPLFPSIFQDCANCLRDVSERFLFGIALSDDLGQRRHEHGEAPVILWLENDGIAVTCRHHLAPVPSGLNRNSARNRIKSTKLVKYVRTGDVQANLERAKGIEPSYAAWEAAVLPLNYARDARGSRPS